jgi:hypothetical protein
MVAEQAKESKGMSVPHSLDTNLQPVTVERSPTAELSPSGSWVRDWENTLKTQQELAKLKTQSIEEAREAQEVAALYHRFLGDSDSDRYVTPTLISRKELIPSIELISTQRILR